MPDAFKNEIRKVVLLERLRKVNALVGFTRIEARDEFADDVAKPSGLCKGPPKFVPACEVFGEGLFLQFDESVIAQWETLPAVKKQEAELRKAYAGWRANRGLDPAKGFPGARFYMLHTIATTRQAFRKESMRNRVRSRWRAFWSIRRHLILTVPWEVWLDWARLKSLA